MGKKHERAVLIPEEVKAWLATKLPEEIVGKPGLSTSCPLATYLLEQGHTNVYVTRDSFHAECLTFYGEDLPRTLIEFVMLVDTDYIATAEPERRKQITAGRALELLDQVLQRRLARTAQGRH